ncbi:MAG: hypothetical protein WA156_15905 [Methylocystis silviterrae]
MNQKKAAPVAAGAALNKKSSHTSYGASPHENQAIPSRATLSRRFPALRINRYTGAWRDDASGAKGDDVVSLLAFINGGPTR